MSSKDWLHWQLPHLVRNRNAGSAYWTRTLPLRPFSCLIDYLILINYLMDYFIDYLIDYLLDWLDWLRQAVMDRDKEQEHFARQAKTMTIIDTYVAEGAPCRVDISDACREKILASDVTRCVHVEAQLYLEVDIEVDVSCMAWMLRNRSYVSGIYHHYARTSGLYCVINYIY